jgi:predicted Zn-ribbon and HTH transcriptional regulator
MVGEQGDSLPPELHEWVDERAAELELDRAAVLGRALTAYRHLVEGGDDIAAASNGVDASLDELDARLDEVDGRVGDIETEFDDKIRDVRERVVQVKRETDAKAHADHSHPDIAESARQAERAAAEAVDRVETVESDLADGFDNFEDVLSYLTDETEDLDDKVGTLAGAVVELRRQVAELEGESSVERAVADLREEANRAGVRTAACEDCGSSVDVALLDEPVCPNCQATFERVEPSRGFFGNATLRVGSRPALLGKTETEVGEPADLFEETTAAETDGGPGPADE